MKVWVVGALLASILGACNQGTASTPVSTAAPAAMLSLQDFKGDWRGTSQLGVPLRLNVTDAQADFAYNGVSTQLDPPQFTSRTMRLKFITGVGHVEFTKESASKVGYLFDGLHNGAPVQSRATLTKVQ